jgi:hypothetical protein
MLGLGSKNDAIKKTPKWIAMSKSDRFNFFRDWWSKLSGEQLDMDEVKDFIGQWASANKFGGSCHHSDEICRANLVLSIPRKGACFAHEYTVSLLIPGVGDDDVRHHKYTSRLSEDTTTLYLRSMSAGALSTFMDSYVPGGLSVYGLLLL